MSAPTRLSALAHDGAVLAAPLALTERGRELIQAKIDRLRGHEMASLRPLLVGVDRDERVVVEFERALQEVARLEGVLAAAERLATPPAGSRARVALGSLVWLRDAATGERFEVRLVHPEEAALDPERISWDSPLARSIIGARVGDVCEVTSPRGAWQCEIRRILR